MNPDPLELLPLKPETFHILLVLERGPLHGYGIIKDVENETDGQIQLEPSPLYRRLKRLLDLGILTQTAPTPPPADERRLYYALTTFGRRVLQAEAARITGLARKRTVKDLANAAGQGT